MNAREWEESRLTREALERHRRIEFEQVTSGRLDRLESEMERLHQETRAVVEEALRKLGVPNGHPHSAKITPNSARFRGKAQLRRASEG